MKYLRELIGQVTELVEDPEIRKHYPPTTLKRLAAYGLLVEAQLDENEAAEDFDKLFGQNVHFTPDGDFEFTFEPEIQTDIKRKNGRKNCKECGTKLTGKRRLFCSKLCSRRNWTKNNREKAREHQRRHYHKHLKLVK